MIVLAIWGALVALFLVIRLAAIHYTARAVALPAARWSRALTATTATFAWEVAAFGLLFVVPHAGNELVMLAAVGLVQIAGAAAILRRVYGGGEATQPRWRYLLISYIATLFVPMVFVQPLGFVTESYVVPENNMAPALAGPRVEAKCSACGGLVYFRFNEGERSLIGPQSQLWSGYCLHCENQYPAGSLTGRVQEPDRFTVEKLSSPRRWSIVAYHHPERPRSTFVGRIVGMPAETIVLRDGFAYAGDQKLEPPAEIGEVRYVSEIDFSSDQHDIDPGRAPLTFWGDPKMPIKLADDEYFMLGDNAKHSLDSRFFGAVKREAIVGTAAVIYWPPSRFRVFP